jgi:hypothetical protein
LRVVRYAYNPQAAGHPNGTSKNVMQPQKIILLPTTHESLPSFNVRRELLSSFLDHLARSGIQVVEPPEAQGDPKQGAVSVVGVDVPEDIPIGRLQEVLDEFLRKHPSPGSTEEN